MPWSEGPVEERKKMIAAWELGEAKAELARRFGVSRQTVYDYIQRWEEHGAAGLEAGSRAPHSNPRQTSAAVANALLDLKQQHPNWGPAKLVRLLANDNIVLSSSTAATSSIETGWSRPVERGSIGGVRRFLRRS